MTTRQILEVWEVLADSKVPCAAIAAKARDFAPPNMEAGLSDTTVYRLLKYGQLPKDNRFRRRLWRYVPRAMFSLAAEHDCADAVAFAIRGGPR
jgi:hypothetical protein